MRCQVVYEHCHQDNSNQRLPPRISVRASRMTRRALLGLGALGALTERTAEAQVRTPAVVTTDHGDAWRDASARPDDQRRDDRRHRVHVLRRLPAIPRVAAQSRGDRRPRVRCARGAVQHDRAARRFALHARLRDPAAPAGGGDGLRARSTRIVSCSSGWWSSGATTFTPTSTSPESTRSTRIAKSSGGMRSARSYDLLVGSGASPAMLTYLNNTESTRTAPNQNYARELMELHTLGVDGGYTQQDVQEVARCFTGWRVTGNTGDARAGTFYFDANRHDNDARSFLASSIAQGGGINDGLNVHQDPRRASEHRAVRVAQAAALAARLRSVAGARRRHRRRVHAERRQHQGARAPHPSATRTCCGRRRS